MGKIKSRTWSRRPSTTQTGVLDYNSLHPRKKRLKGKTKRRRAKARSLIAQRDAIRQVVDAENGVDFDIVAQILAKHPRMTLKEAKRIACA